MKSRLPLLLSVVALLVAVLGPGAIGGSARAAGQAIVKRAAFAYRAGHARYARDAVHATRADRAGSARKAARADVAANASAVNGIQASRTPTPNKLLPLDANGKLPSSIGAVGPAGAKGATGPQGPPGVSGAVLVTADSGSNSNTVKSQSVSCPSGKQLLGNATDLDGDGRPDGYANGFEALKALATKYLGKQSVADGKLDQNELAALEQKAGLSMLNVNALWPRANEAIAPPVYIRGVPTGPLAPLVAAVTTVGDTLYAGISFRTAADSYFCRFSS